MEYGKTFGIRKSFCISCNKYPVQEKNRLFISGPAKWNRAVYMSYVSFRFKGKFIIIVIIIIGGMIAGIMYFQKIQKRNIWFTGTVLAIMFQQQRQPEKLM